MNKQSEGSGDVDETRVTDLDEAVATEEGGVDDTPDDSAAEGPEGDGGDAGEGASGADDDADLGSRAQKRIRDLTKARNEAEADVTRLKKELEDARRLAGDDGKALLRAAEASGVLPGLMTKEEAEGFSRLDELPGLVKMYRRWLNHHDRSDELAIGDGQTMDYGDVQERLETLRDELEDLKGRYGERRRELQAKVAEIFALGEAAAKAGWKPGAKAKAKVAIKQETRPDAGAKPWTAAGSGRRRAEEMDVNSDDDLEAFMAADRRQRRK